MGRPFGGAVPALRARLRSRRPSGDISKQNVSNSSLDAQEICQALAGDSEKRLKIRGFSEEQVPVNGLWV
jgi:hypothetical protein